MRFVTSSPFDVFRQSVLVKWHSLCVWFFVRACSHFVTESTSRALDTSHIRLMALQRLSVQESYLSSCDSHTCASSFIICIRGSVVFIRFRAAGAVAQFDLCMLLAFPDAAAEKRTRAAFKSEVERRLNRGSVVVLDTLNSIKGFR